MDRWWVPRFLAAIGIGHRKAEDDVSYDPALDEDLSGDDLAQSGERGKDRHSGRLGGVVRWRLRRG
ncbi:MAG TPA: hypothetical protein VMG38_08720 [Trebonia sp.]|nr:hypothetical protein [Trebonia sp.]